MAAKTPRTTRIGDLCGYHPVKDKISDTLPQLYGFLAEKRPDRVLSRRIGCAVGMYVGDGQGNNKEFQPFDPTKCDDPHPVDEMLLRKRLLQADRGQQTDDASMGHVLFVNYALYGHLYDLLLAKAGFLRGGPAATAVSRTASRVSGSTRRPPRTGCGQIGSTLNFNEPPPRRLSVPPPPS